MSAGALIELLNGQYIPDFRADQSIEVLQPKS